MGGRILARLTELGWDQVDLLRRVPDLDAKALSAMIKRNGAASQWSDDIARALGVAHRWLQTGNGPKEPSDIWPFLSIDRDKVLLLPSRDIDRLEAALVATASHFRFDILKRGDGAPSIEKRQGHAA